MQIHPWPVFGIAWPGGPILNMCQGGTPVSATRTAMRTRIFSILALLSLLSTADLVAQEAREVAVDAYPSPQGVWLMLSELALAPGGSGPAAAVILRADGEGGSFREVGRAARVANVAELRRMVSPETLSDIPVDTLSDRAVSDQELWNFVVTHPNMTEYDVAILDPQLRLALGVMYLDSTVRNAAPGTRYSYRVRFVDANGTTLREEGPVPVEVNTQLASAKPELIKTVERDSIIAVSWWMPRKGNEAVQGGILYRQTGGYGPFEKIDAIIIPSHGEDSIRFSWEEQGVGPNEMYSYVLVPTGMMGQPGPSSDTVTAISVSFREIALLGNLTAHDTATGIYLDWDPVIETPYFLGVEISRSREALLGYEPIDTVPLSQSNYTDITALPLIPNYYRLKFVTFREIGDVPSAGVTGVHRPLDHAPDAPYAVEAMPEGRNIRLRWQHVSDTALWGYLVYRGTATLDSMVVVSRATQDTTWLDTAAILSGRTTYAYRVKAISLGELESPYSEPALARPNRTIIPPTPLGVTGYADGGAVRLFWNDAGGFDDAVTGFRIWRRSVAKGTGGTEMRADESATAAAARLGFKQLVNDTLLAAAFDDPSAAAGETYEYAVSAVDDFGAESGLCTPFRISLDGATPEPPAAIYARMVERGVEVSWDPVVEPGATGYVIWRRTRADADLHPVARLSATETVWTDSTSLDEAIYAISTAGPAGDGRPGPERMVVR